MRFPLEELKQVLKTEEIIFAIGKIQALHLAQDRSVLRCTCQILSEGDDYSIIARSSWEYVGPDSGDFQFPAIGDMVLIAYVNDDPDLAFIIKSFTSREDTIPQNATTGDRVIKTLKEKNLWLTGQKAVYLTKGDEIPTENIVLGQVFKKFASDLIDNLMDLLTAVEGMTHTGNLGNPTSPPLNVAMFTQIKAKLMEIKQNPVDNDNILSGVAFTSKE